MGRGVGRQHDPHRCRAAIVDAEIMRDRARHERRYVRALARKLDDRPDDDLRLVGRRKADEPSVIRTVRVLRRTRFSRDRQTREPRAARGALLHHGDHRAPQRRQLIGAEIEGHVLGARSPASGGPHDERRPHVAIARELLVQPHHLHERLRVLALPDREVQRDGGRPAARTVNAIVVLGSRRELRWQLSGEIDPRTSAESPGIRILEQRRDPKLDTELVEIDVAALRDGLRERQRTVAARVPAPEVTIPVLQPAAAGDRHFAARSHDAALQRHRRHGQLPRGARRIPRLDGAIEQRMRGTLVERAPVRRGDSPNKGVGIESRCAIERQHFSGIRI